MNKLILISLVIFFAICSKSWAEEEIWDCEIYMGKFHKGTRTYKIDAHIHGDIYIRLDAMWKSFRNKKGNDEVASMFLDEVNENIRVNYKYPGLHEVESTGWTHNVFVWCMCVID